MSDDQHDEGAYPGKDQSEWVSPRQSEGNADMGQAHGPGHSGTDVHRNTQ
jgi:hypothetical protein